MNGYACLVVLGGLARASGESNADIIGDERLLRRLHFFLSPSLPPTPSFFLWYTTREFFVKFFLEIKEI